MEDWPNSVKNNRQGDILSLFTLCALTSCHAVVHLRNGNLWTTIDSPSSYDHDQLLSICDVHLAYIGNGLFVELHQRKVTPGECLTMSVELREGTTCSASQSCPQDECATGTTEAVQSIPPTMVVPASPIIDPSPYIPVLPEPSSSDVSIIPIHHESDTDAYSEHATSPVNLTDDPPTTIDDITITVGTIKSDPDTLANLVSSSTSVANTATQAKYSLSDVKHNLMLPEGNIIKPSIVKLHKLSDIDIDLWTSKKTAVHAKEPLKPTQIWLEKDVINNNVTESLVHKQSRHKLTSKRKHITNKSKEKSKHHKVIASSPRLNSRVTHSQKIEDA